MLRCIRADKWCSSPLREFLSACSKTGFPLWHCDQTQSHTSIHMQIATSLLAPQQCLQAECWSTCKKGGLMPMTLTRKHWQFIDRCLKRVRPGVVVSSFSSIDHKGIGCCDVLPQFRAPDFCSFSKQKPTGGLKVLESCRNAQAAALSSSKASTVNRQEATSTDRYLQKLRSAKSIGLQ